MLYGRHDPWVRDANATIVRMPGGASPPLELILMTIVSYFQEAS